jgi:4'-phosphopantetheinyl transferase
MPDILLYIIEHDTVLEPATRQQWLRLLSISDQQRYLRFQRWQDSQAFLLGRMLLAYGLISAGKPLSILKTFNFPPFEKPQLNDADLAFNISHSGPIVVCGLGPIAVGVDVEAYHDEIELADYEMMFCHQELQYLRSLSSNELPKSFSWLWTRKEAVLKLVGDGLGGDLKQLNCLNDATNYKGQPVYLYSFHPGEMVAGHMAAFEPITLSFSHLSCHHFSSLLI